MPLVIFNYQLKNGIAVADCTTSCTGIDLVVDTDKDQLCGEKYFELRIVDVQYDGSNTLTTFTYNGDRYTTDEALSTLIPKINSVFVCDTTTDCQAQDCKFSLDLTAVDSDKRASTTIVEEVMLVQPVRQYEFTNIEVDAVTYTFGTFWDDSIDGSASTNVADYIDAIIAYIEALSIPEYIGSVNLARNGMAVNNQGVGMLEMYFDVGTTPVNINIQDTTSTIVGAVSTLTASVTAYMNLELTDTSIVSAGDTIETFTFEITDGVYRTFVQDDNPTIPVYSVFETSQNINTTNKGLVISECIATTNECVSDNVGIAIIPHTDILACLTSQTPYTATSL
jgi:hypothetical protein